MPDDWKEEGTNHILAFALTVYQRQALRKTKAWARTVGSSNKKESTKAELLRRQSINLSKAGTAKEEIVGVAAPSYQALLCFVCEG